MDYNQLNNTYKYDMLAEQIYQRQMEHFHYNFDKTNYEHMLASDDASLNREYVQKNLDDTITQMAIVENIYNALVAQIDDQPAYQAAVARRNSTANSSTSTNN
jgi:hypothetical protein